MRTFAQPLRRMTRERRLGHQTVAVMRTLTREGRSAVRLVGNRVPRYRQGFKHLRGLLEAAGRKVGLPSFRGLARCGRSRRRHLDPSGSSSLLNSMQETFLVLLHPRVSSAGARTDSIGRLQRSIRPVIDVLYSRGGATPSRSRPESQRRHAPRSLHIDEQSVRRPPADLCRLGILGDGWRRQLCAFRRRRCRFRAHSTIIPGGRARTQSSILSWCMTHDGVPL